MIYIERILRSSPGIRSLKENPYEGEELLLSGRRLLLQILVPAGRFNREIMALRILRLLASLPVYVLCVLCVWVLVRGEGVREGDEEGRERERRRE